MYFYSENIIGSISADITVVLASGDVYSGKFDRSKADYNSDLKAQAIWQVVKTAVTESDGVSTYETLYPEGSKAFNQKWNDFADLSYSYSKN